MVRNKAQREVIMSILAREGSLNSIKMLNTDINERLYVHDDDPNSDQAELSEILSQFNL